MSFYFICVFGLRSVFSLILDNTACETPSAASLLLSYLFLRGHNAHATVHTYAHAVAPKHSVSHIVFVSAMQPWSPLPTISSSPLARSSSPTHPILPHPTPPPSPYPIPPHPTTNPHTTATDQMMAMQQQMAGAGAGAPPDPAKAFKAEWEAMEVVQHDWALNPKARRAQSKVPGLAAIEQSLLEDWGAL